jgi:hypothetical protein
MIERTNQEWLAALRGPGRDEALADLRALLVRGLACTAKWWMTAQEPIYPCCATIAALAGGVGAASARVRAVQEV